MTRPPHLRSWLLSATLVVLAVAAWLVLAPTQIGGETSYVTTSGISMAPRFHSGDLAVVRPAENYKVGDIVAYRSTMLRTVVLHRIIAVKGDRYVFKGDNNDFVDPTRPSSRRPGRQAVAARRARRPRPRLAAHPLHGRSADRWPGRAPAPGRQRSSAGAVTAAGRPRRAPAVRCGDRAGRRHPRRPRADGLHRLRGGCRGLRSRSARSRSPARRPSPIAREDALHREGQLRLPRQGARRTGLPGRRRDDGRPDLPEARAPRPRQGSLPPDRDRPAARRRHHGGPPAPRRAPPAGTAPSSSPLQSASRATTPPPT